MKGRTIIELKDQSGTIEHYENENMITDGPTQYLQMAGPAGSNPYTDTLLDDALGTLFGGIMLFDNAIEEKADNIIPPGGITMIGNAVKGMVNTADPPELGSYNESESGWMQDGSFKMVFDFATNQANGTINCVCLTSADFAKIGAGNMSGKSYSSDKTFFDLSGTVYRSFLIDGYDIRKRIVEISAEKSSISVLKYSNIELVEGKESDYYINNGKLIIEEYLIQLSVFDFRNQSILLSTKEITLPEEFMNHADRWNQWWACATDKAYVMFTPSIGNLWPNNKIQVLSIEGNAVTSYSYTNNGDLIEYVWESSCVINDKLILASTAASGNRIIDLKNPLDEIIPEVRGSNYPSMAVAYADNRMISSTQSWDLEKNMVISTNGKSYYEDNYTYAASMCKDNKTYKVYEGKWNTHKFIKRSTCFISTINNLEEQVIKTADKTMKVTYILTFDEQEG